MNSVEFNKSNEYLASGLANGLVKVWDLKSKDVIRTFRPSSYSLKQSITSV